MPVRRIKDSNFFIGLQLIYGKIKNNLEIKNSKKNQTETFSLVKNSYFCA